MSKGVKKNKYFLKIKNTNKLLNKTGILHLKGIINDIRRQVILNLNNDTLKFKPVDNFNNTTIDIKYLDFIKIFNNCINYYFNSIKPEINFDNTEIEQVITKLNNLEDNDLTISKFLFSNPNYLDDKIKLLLLRLLQFHQTFISFLFLNRNGLFNINILFIKTSSKKIIVFDVKTNSIVNISYLIVTISIGDQNYDGEYIIGKVITSLKIDSINDDVLCILELDFNLNIPDSITNEAIIGKMLKEQIIEYLQKKHTIFNSINILQCLATKTYKDTPNSMKPSREVTEEQINSFLPRFLSRNQSLKQNKNKFFETDTTGNQANSICYRNTNHDDPNDHNYCTYDGILNYFNNNNSIRCEQSDSSFLILQIKKFFSLVNNIATSLFIVTDIATLNKIFGVISPLLINPLDFVLLTNSKLTVYNRILFTNEYTSINEDNILVKNLGEALIKVFDIKSYQNIYFIAQAENTKYDILTEANDIYDPPISILNMIAIEKFINKIKELFKYSIPVLVSSHLARSILTTALLYMFIEDINLEWLQYRNTNIQYTLQLFMFINILKHILIEKNSQLSLQLPLPISNIQNNKKRLQTPSLLPPQKTLLLVHQIPLLPLFDNLRSYFINTFITNPSTSIDPKIIIKEYSNIIIPQPFFYNPKSFNSNILTNFLIGGYKLLKTNKYKSKKIKYKNNIIRSKHIKIQKKKNTKKYKKTKYRNI